MFDLVLKQNILYEKALSLNYIDGRRSAQRAISG